MIPTVGIVGGGGTIGDSTIWNQYGYQGAQPGGQAYFSAMWQQQQMGGQQYWNWTGVTYQGIQTPNPYHSYPVQYPGVGLLNHAAAHEEASSTQPTGDVEKVVSEDRQGDRQQEYVQPSSPHPSMADAGREDREGCIRRFVIPDKVPTRTGDEQQHEEKFLLPLICTLLGNEAFILGLIHRNDQIVLPVSLINGIPSPELVEARVRQMYADRFCFRLFPEEAMSKITIDTPARQRIKFYIPLNTLIDARIPVPHWEELPAVGLTCIPLRVLLEDSSTELSNVLVEPRGASHFLKGLNERMSLNKNLESGFVQDVLGEKWQSSTPVNDNAVQDRAASERIQSTHAPNDSDGQA